MRLSACVLFFICCCIVTCKNAEEDVFSENSIHPSFTESTVLIDGRFDEAVWQSTPKIILQANKSSEAVTDSNVITWIKTCYDDRKFYIAFHCNDPDIWGNFTNRDQHLWTEEAVEVFIDTDANPDSYVEIEVSPRNVLFDSYIVNPVEIDIKATKKFNLPDIQSAVVVNGTLDNRNDEDNFWAVEIAIPFDNLSVLLPGKNQWKINFYRINRDGKGQQKSYAWLPTGGRFHNPAAFGKILFDN